MNKRILTLFGEEVIPEQLNGVSKTITAPAQPEAPKAVNFNNLDSRISMLDAAKKYYTIGEVAELFEVKTSKIRFWTTEFNLKVRTTKKGDRLYTAEIIKELYAIHKLVNHSGYTLAGAKAKLKSPNHTSIDTTELKKSLLLLRNKLAIIKKQL